MVIIYVISSSRSDWILDTVRRIRILYAFRLLLMQLCYRHIIFPTIMWKTIMPEDIVLHERNAITFDRICNDYCWFMSIFLAVLICFSESIFKLFMIISIYLNRIPPKSTPLIPKVLYFKRILLEIQTLHMVVVNNCHKVIQTEMVRK